MDTALVAECARQVARRVADRRTRQRALARLRRDTSKPLVNSWRPAGFSMGGAGLAVMAAAFDDHFPGTGWDVLGHELLASGLDEMNGTDTSLSMFSGTVGYAAAAWQASQQGRRYRGLLDELDARLLPRMDAFARSLAASDGPAPRAYDTVTGISGWVGHLTGRTGSASHAVAGSVAGALVALLNEGGLGRMSYRPAPGAGPVVDCGLAHGLAGPLVALSLLELHHRFGRPDVDASIRWAAGWLMDRAAGRPGVVLWPAAAEPAGGSGQDDEPVNAGSWCHGSSGIARALFLAGTAVQAPRYREFALRAFRTHCDARPDLSSPNLCHGLAGQLVITLAFAHDSDEPGFRIAAARLAGELLDRYRPDSLLGYLDREENGAEVDHPGLLRGAAGVALALLAAAGGDVPPWARLLLLA
jgi:hypothetical protein